MLTWANGVDPNQTNKAEQGLQCSMIYQHLFDTSPEGQYIFKNGFTFQVAGKIESDDILIFLNELERKYFRLADNSHETASLNFSEKYFF